MNVEVNKVNGIEIFKLKGKLDQQSATVLKGRFEEALKRESKRFHFNLSQLDFINSVGLGMLLSISKDIRLIKGRLTFSDLNQYVEEIFDLTQLCRIFEIFPTEEEAIFSYESDITNTNIVNCEQHF